MSKVKTIWRRPNESDKKRTCIARNPYEEDAFQVRWNKEQNTWSLKNNPNCLILVTEILEDIKPVNKEKQNV